MSKCAGCDQHNAVIYHDDDMYCEDCYKDALIDYATLQHEREGLQMTELNLTEYEFGFLVAKSQDIVKRLEHYDGDYWHSVTVVDVVHGRKDTYYDLNIWDDDEGKMSCTAYAIHNNGHTDGNTFTRVW